MPEPDDICMAASGLDRVAGQVEAGLPLKSVWSAIHGACEPVDRGYGYRLGHAFGALCLEADCTAYYLGDVLRSRYNDRDKMAGLLRAAARRSRNIRNEVFYA